MPNLKPKRSRRWFVGAGIGAVGVVAASLWWRSRSKPYTPQIDIGPGLRVLKKYPSVDIHSHPGRSFLAEGDFDSLIISSMDSGFEAERIADMRAGNVSASCFAIVADVQVLGLTVGQGIVATRAFRPDEAYADFQRQLNHLVSLKNSGTLEFAFSANEIRAAHREGRQIAVLCSEGADFVEDQLQRLTTAYDAGVRSITLVHYRPSEYGDIQTAPPVHGGLTRLGADVVNEMNRIGLVIDVAHASFDTVVDVVEISSAPLMLSHSHLQTETVKHPRLISTEHAKLIATNGGVIGSWPSGVSNRTLVDFVDETLRLVDVVGIDHVAIGTDLDANYKPVLTDYQQFPELAALLLQRGLSEEEAGKVLGLNFLRVFDAVSAAATTRSDAGRI